MESSIQQLLKLLSPIERFLQISNTTESELPQKTINVLSGLQKDINHNIKEILSNANSLVGSVGIPQKCQNFPEDVALIQQKLNIKVTGFYNEETEKAIENYQRSIGFKKPDGIISPTGRTFNKMQEEQTIPEITSEEKVDVVSISTLKIGQSVGNKGANKPDDVKVIQQLLDLDVTGIYTKDIGKEIQDFQEDYDHLTNDGRVDVGGATWKQLIEAYKEVSELQPRKAVVPITIESRPIQPLEISSTPSRQELLKLSTPIGISIEKSVGRGGANTPKDVALVQRLFKLKETGIINGRTIRHIKRLQRRELNMRPPSGIMHPEDVTWMKLSGNKISTPHVSTETPTEMQLDKVLGTKSNIGKSVGRKGNNAPEDVILIKTLLNKFDNNQLELTDKPDKQLFLTIDNFQKKYLGSTKPDGRVDPRGKTWNTLLGIARIEGKLLKMTEKYNVEPAVVLAIQSVESGGNGFLSDGRPKILFEGHQFWQELKKVGINPRKHQKGNEDILYPKWTKKYYIGNIGEYSRLDRAKKIHLQAALKATSWGEFQILGSNYSISVRPDGTPFKNVEEFVEAMHLPGSYQLSSLMGFLDNNKLFKHVQGKQKNWAALARGYNGPDYAKNQYDKRLKNAYDRFSKIYPAS